MSKTKSIIENIKPSKSKKKATKKNMTSPRILLAGRLAFIKERLNVLNNMKAEQIANKGNAVSPVTLQAAREVYSEKVKRISTLAESEISSNSTINLNKIFANLSENEIEDISSLINDNDEDIHEDNIISNL